MYLDYIERGVQNPVVEGAEKLGLRRRTSRVPAPLPDDAAPDEFLSITLINEPPAGRADDPSLVTANVFCSLDDNGGSPAP